MNYTLLRLGQVPWQMTHVYVIKVQISDSHFLLQLYYDKCVIKYTNIENTKQVQVLSTFFNLNLSIQIKIKLIWYSNSMPFNDIVFSKRHPFRHGVTMHPITSSSTILTDKTFSASIAFNEFHSENNSYIFSLHFA